jgi:hypothetical protein
VADDVEGVFVRALARAERPEDRRGGRRSLLRGLDAPRRCGGCTHVEVVPTLAPTRLDVTMDPGEGGVVLEDDARRHAAPVGMMQRRVYAVETSVVRWYPRSPRRPRPNRFVWLPSLPAVPTDRVALRGSPPPMPGQRFVLFDDKGPQGVVMARRAVPAGP